MIDHVSIPVRDLKQSAEFYESVLSKIGFAKLVDARKAVGFGRKYPELWLNHRPEMDEHGMSDGFHVCLRARTIGEAQEFHEAAVALGAPSAMGEHGPGGEPGLPLCE